MPKIAAIQINSSSTIGMNLINVCDMMYKAKQAGASMVVLPENFAFIGTRAADMYLVEEQLGEGRIQNFISAQAKELNIWVIAGTIPITSPTENKAYATCIVWNNAGKMVTHYHKMHLFDANLKQEGLVYKESNQYVAGDTGVVVNTPLGNVGLSVCYDLRFTDLYTAMRNAGAQIITVPAAFTQITGKYHWMALLKARAIETQCYIVAANQTGLHDNGYKSFGHSMIISPWGEILDCQPNGRGFIMANIDLAVLNEVREKLPVWEHRHKNYNIRTIK